MDINVIVKYRSSAGFMTAKAEIQDILTRQGDQKAEMELLAPGVIGVASKLKNRDIVENTREAYVEDPDSLKATTEWIPVDAWCAVDRILPFAREELQASFFDNDRVLVEVIVHRGSAKAEEIKKSLLSLVKGVIYDVNPSKVLRVDIADNNAGVTLMKPNDVLRIV